MTTTATTLAELATEWDSLNRVWNSDACVPEARFPHEDGDDRPDALLLGDLAVPLDDHGLDHVLIFYKIPNAFFRRQKAALQETLLNACIDAASDEVSITYNSRGIVEVLKPSQPRLHPLQFIEAARQAVPADARVIGYWLNAQDIRLDVVDPTRSRSIKSNTLKPGSTLTPGVRFGQNRKQNLAPWVAPILQHSSGAVLQIHDPSLRIEARRKTAETIAHLMTAEAVRAIERTDHDLDALVDLAGVDISANRITVLNRFGAEHKLPARPMAQLTTRFSRMSNTSMYDLALAVAEAAEADTLIGENNRNTRTRLQDAAGRIVADHAERCNRCFAAIAA